MRTLRCPRCKKEFTTWNSHVKKRRYCSIHCARKSRIVKSKKVIIYCLNCKKEIKIPPCRIGVRKNCSRKCAKVTRKMPEGMGEKIRQRNLKLGIRPPVLRGENSPFWIDGRWRKNYTERQIAMGSVSYRQWRKLVFERDNYVCQQCGIRSGNGKKVILQAHHIKNWKEYIDLRFELSNGTTLCRTCHLTLTFPKRFLKNIKIDPEKFQGTTLATCGQSRKSILQ